MNHHGVAPAFDVVLGYHYMEWDKTLLFHALTRYLKGKKPAGVYADSSDDEAEESEPFYAPTSPPEESETLHAPTSAPEEESLTLRAPTSAPEDESPEATQVSKPSSSPTY